MVVLNWTRKFVITLIGFAVLAAGLGLALPGIPGPGLLLMIAGFAILGLEYTWAKSALDSSKQKLRRITQPMQKTKAKTDPQENKPK
ncbi:MAG TPA: PGPGW domain-containing protein [Candidatus Dormibacteraeota bacterium]|nr:PGPGW domain-containing protein [Candidatus Dormibacteraeota bacterium]